MTSNSCIPNAERTRMQNADVAVDFYHRYKVKYWMPDDILSFDL